MTATINIGLAIGDRLDAITEARALEALLAHTGDNPITYVVTQSATERTLVAVLEEAATDGALWALCAELEQDCIAQQVEGQPGHLVGPLADEWAPFDPARFIDWPTASVRAARAAVSAAAYAQRLVESAFDDARTAARWAVEKEYAEARNAASRALGEAKTALGRAENAAALPHEWEGKTVVIREPVYTRWRAGPTSEFTERRGVVETYKHGTDTGPGRSYFQPGDAMVRLLKKDGTPGARTCRLTETDLDGAKWELV